MAQFHCTAARILALLPAFLVAVALSAPDGAQGSSVPALIPPPKVAAGSTVADPHFDGASCLNQRAVVLTNTDSPGADLESFPATDLNACKRKCEKETSCNSFVFISDLCYLKSSVGPMNVQPGATVGVMYRASNTKCVVVADANSPGNDITDFVAPSRDVCCQICVDMPTCYSFLWNVAGSHCWLKTVHDSIKMEAGNQMGFPKIRVGI